jgi:hypothetical protein
MERTGCEGFSAEALAAGDSVVATARDPSKIPHAVRDHSRTLAAMALDSPVYWFRERYCGLEIPQGLRRSLTVGEVDGGTLGLHV